MLECSGRLFKFNETEEMNTEVMEIFVKTTELHEKFPEVLLAIDSDLDKHGLKKKQLRVETKKFKNNLASNSSDDLFYLEKSEGSVTMKLENGRPRMKAPIVLFFMTLRGLWGSVSDHASSERIYDSRSIYMILSDSGYRHSGINTIRENLNAVSNETRRLILGCQAKSIVSKQLDDFDKIFIDSTSVKANTAYPTDISVLYKLIDRANRIFSSLESFGLPAVSESWTATRIEKMKKHLSFMSMQAGKQGVKGKVKECYRLFSTLAVNVINTFLMEQERVMPYWENAELSPVKRIALDDLWYRLDSDLYDAINVLRYADLSIEKGVKLPSPEKVLSISDKDAAYIIKGQRNGVVGYKPQIARSQNGFICGYMTPIGNAADSEMLVPMVENAILTTGVIPSWLSVDDGYSSESNVKRLRNIFGISTTSFSGSKGKKLTIEEWDATSYMEARRMRSSIESTIFTIKFNHKFGVLRRRGIKAVDAEQLEKIIAYNFVRIIRKEAERVRKETAA